MSGDSCCGPITILFVSIVVLTVLYLILGYDMLCRAGTVLTAVLGIVIIYEIFTGGPSTGASSQPSETRYSEPPKRGVKLSGEDVRRALDMSESTKEKNDEDAEADEDLAIAYEAMNDWEDFEDL